MASITGQTVSHYKIVVKLGGGESGAVYKAEDTRIGHLVALKLLPQEVAANHQNFAQFQDEVRAISALKHPNICSVLDIDEWEGHPLLAMELLEGEPLSQRISGRPLRFPDVADFGAQIADALDAAHACGILHRDIQPGCVLVNRRGQAKVLNFGLARLFAPRAASPSAASPTLATMRQIGPDASASPMGGLAYQSPEQLRGEGLDARSDLFSLGAVLYEMATGQPAFSGPDDAAIREAILNEQPLAPSRSNSLITERFDELIAKALEKERDLRYQAAAELRTDLRRLRRDWESDRVVAARSALADSLPRTQAGTQSAVPSAMPVPARPSPGRTSGPLVGAIVLGVIVGLLGGAAAMYEFRRPPRPALPVFQRLTFRRGTVSSARFAPDGETIVYTASWGGGPPEVFTVRPGAAAPHSLGLNEADVLGVSSTGEVAVAQNVKPSTPFEMAGELARVPITGGTPQKMLDDVEWADWVPDGSGLAVVHRVGSFDRLEYPVGKVLYQTAGWIGPPRFSPKGDALAFVDHPSKNSDAGTVDTVDLAGNKRTLSEQWPTVRGLAWSASGSEIWFTAGRLGGPQLYAVNLKGQSRQVMATPGSFTLADIAGNGQALMIREEDQAVMSAVMRGQPAARNLSWLDSPRLSDMSADGKTILFNENVGGGAHPSVYMRTVDGASAPRRVGEGDGLALSPDGKSVLAESSTHQLVLLDTGGGEPSPLPASDLSHTWAQWLPQGNRFVFLGSQPGRGMQLFVEDASGAPPRSISPEGTSSSAAVSPNGRSVAAVGPDGKGYLYPIDGGSVPTLRGLTSADRFLGWSQDGHALFVAQGDLPAKVFRVDTGSGARTLLWQLVPADSAGVSSIGRIRVSRDGKLCVYSYDRRLSELFLTQGLQ